MEVQRLLIWVCFFFCLGLTVGGALLFFRLKETAKLPAVRYLQYYLIMMYAYAYYAMWSDIFVRLLFPLEDQALISKISNFLFLISTPFLLIGLLVLIGWGLRMRRAQSTPLLLTSTAMSVVCVGAMSLRLDTTWQLEQWFALLMLAALVFVIVLLSFSPLRYLRAPKKVALILMLLFLTLIQLAVIFNLLALPVLELLFVFLFFLTHTGIGVYFIYAGDFPQQVDEAPAEMSFSGFIEKYGITTREEEIILEIYKGKTNREIAEGLFVTVQTIKDHTHRIYQKTEVKNRTQLASLLRSFESR